MSEQSGEMVESRRDDEWRLDVERGRELLHAARRVVVMTGAGISAESGVPTFRGPDGFWRHHRPEDLATPEAFARDPRLVWEWYAWRRDRINQCRPNAAHLALARLARERDGVRIITQNVDGLHTAAAYAVGGKDMLEPALPLELHGSIFRVRCTACEDRYEHRDPIDTGTAEALPRCRRCDSLLRPDVAWFGEPLDFARLEEASRIAATADLCLVIGTSAQVQPAASLPRRTRECGGKIIEVNLEPTPLSDAADVSIRARAAAAIPILVHGPNLSVTGG